MSRWRSLVSLPVSLAFHAVGLLLVLLLFRSEALPPSIVLDLTATSPHASPPRAPRLASERSAARSAPQRPERAEPAPIPSRQNEARSPSAAPVPAPVPSPGLQVASRIPSGPHAAAPATKSEEAPRPSDRADGWVATPLASAPLTGGEGRFESAGSLNEADSGVGGEPSLILSRGRSGSGTGTGSDPRQRLALAVPGAGPDGLGAEYGPYLARLRERIQQALEYPSAARRRGLTGSVNMEIVIRPDGAIAGVSLLQSSSHPILDQAALDAVRRLQPLPFPAELPPRTLSVRLPVVFELR